MHRTDLRGQSGLELCKRTSIGRYVIARPDGLIRFLCVHGKRRRYDPDREGDLSISSANDGAPVETKAKDLTNEKQTKLNIGLARD